VSKTVRWKIIRALVGTLFKGKESRLTASWFWTDCVFDDGAARLALVAGGGRAFDFFKIVALDAIGFKAFRAIVAFKLIRRERQMAMPAT
jgi:hypothetical protein